MKIVKSQNYDSLLEVDQLKTSMKDNRALVGFTEGKIKFGPTFKVQRKEETEYEVSRLPAWCDRILWKSADGYDVKQLEYNSRPDVSASDHKPVYAIFELNSWNRPPALNDDCKKAELQFKDVSATNCVAADLNGTSDPYIYFPRQLLIEKHLQSKRINNTLNPVWGDDVKPLPLFRTNLLFLSNALLLLQIRDHDMVGKDSTIGYGTISLRESAKNIDKWCKFTTYLTLDGGVAGVLKGNIKLVYETFEKPKNKN